MGRKNQVGNQGNGFAENLQLMLIFEKNLVFYAANSGGSSVFHQ
jgi:hypothetical protein